MINEKTKFFFVFQKYGKFYSISLGVLSEDKPLIPEECYAYIVIIFKSEK